MAGDTLPAIGPDAIERMLARADDDSRFAWQNRAASAIEQEVGRAGMHPTLVLNLAATGSGKTRMNLRMVALLQPDVAPRISLALNLRTLTLQSGAALRRDFGIDRSTMAVVIGDPVVTRLHEDAARKFADEDENPIEEDVAVVDGRTDLPGWMSHVLRTERDRTIVSTPLLVSTVDYLVKAGEPEHQGHHIKALIRLISSDLILDEIDSYEPAAFCAVLRLVELSAMAGRNVVCSSATLSASVSEPLQRAFHFGLRMRAELLDAQAAATCSMRCVVVDDRLEPLVWTAPVEAGIGALTALYRDRLTRLSAVLHESPTKRLAFLVRHEPTLSGWREGIFGAVRRLHAHWHKPWLAVDGSSAQVRVSFGLVRVSTVAQAVLTARWLAGQFPEARVACYHGADFVASRHLKERALDELLSRGRGSGHMGRHPQVAPHLHGADRMFIVVATPVEEVGRDHDFDWAVLDASSAQSLVQAAGRVNRHRLVDCQGEPNIAVLRYNFRHCMNADAGYPDRPAFAWPGLEPRAGGDAAAYRGHDLAGLLPWDNDRLPIDARIRFESQRCRLSAADEEQIENFVDRYFGSAGKFTSADVQAVLMAGGMESVYGSTALRARDGKDEIVRMRVDDPQIQLERLQRVLRGGRVTDAWLAFDLKEIDAMSNAWLVSDVHEMQALCDSAGVDADDALRVTLPTYGSGGRGRDLGAYRWDLGFGFYAVSDTLRRHDVA